MAGSSEPYVCNWVSGSASAYCGKRFANSDDLLNHLRSHTGPIDPSLGLFSNPLAAAATPFLGVPRAGFPDMR